MKTNYMIKKMKAVMFQYNLSSALAENEKLKKQINELKEKLEAVEKEIWLLTEIKEISDSENKKEKEKNLYENIMEAYIEYAKGNIKECALKLLEIDSKSITDNNLLEKYNDLVEKTYKKASELFYFEGYENYKNKKYSEAVKAWIFR